MTPPDPDPLPGRRHGLQPARMHPPSVLTLVEHYHAARARSARIAAEAEAMMPRGTPAAAAELKLDLRMVRAEANRLACDILEAAPATAANALAKIEFVASLLSDGGAIGPDRLAGLLRDCVAICAEDMRPLWQTDQPCRRRH